MSEILQYILTSAVSALFGGGIGCIFYIKQQKKLKNLEVKAAEANVKSDEINNLSASNEEWIRLYHEEQEKFCKLQERCDELTDRLEDIHNEKKDLWERYSNCQIDCTKKDLVISELNWYRCEVNTCPYRKPPRNYGEYIFPKDGANPEEIQDEEN